MIYWQYIDPESKKRSFLTNENRQLKMHDTHEQIQNILAIFIILITICIN